MTQGFWGGAAREKTRQREQAARERYLDTYWSRLPGIWVHGDWALVDGDGVWYILGRSDDTIKVAGKRLGPAEVEAAVAGHPALAETAAVGVPHPVKGEDVYLFCVLRPGWTPAPRPWPTRWPSGSSASSAGPCARGGSLFARELPKTRNAKVMRRLIRAVASGSDELGDLTGLENPAAIDVAAWRACASGTGTPAG